MSRCKSCNSVLNDLELSRYIKDRQTGKLVPEDLCGVCVGISEQEWSIFIDKEYHHNRPQLEDNPEFFRYSE